MFETSRVVERSWETRVLWWLFLFDAHKFMASDGSDCRQRIFNHLCRVPRLGVGKLCSLYTFLYSKESVVRENSNTLTSLLYCTLWNIMCGHEGAIRAKT